MAEGTIVGEPAQLADEVRDADWPMVLALLILLVDVCVLIAVVGVIALVISLVLLIVSWMASVAAGGLFSRLFSPIFRAVSWLFRRLFNGGHDPNDKVRVLEYRLGNWTGRFDSFRVKGDSERQFRSGDKVRLWARLRRGSYYFVHGELRGEQGWIPVRRRVRNLGWVWLTLAVALNAAMYWIYVTNLAN